MLRYVFFFVLFVFTSIVVNSQTVIEMMYPADANLVLLIVDKPADADIVVYKTEDKSASDQWDCQWKFKKWGFSNFSVYLVNNEKDSLLNVTESGKRVSIDGKIYFTDNPQERGYKDKDFRLEGVFRKIDPNEIDW